MKISLVSIVVRNPLEAFEFYTAVLGFKEKLYMPEAQIAIVVSPEESGGTALMLEPRDNPISKTWQEALYNSGIPVIVMGVPDVQKEYQRLKDKGIAFKQMPTKNDWGTEAVFDDTCGNYIKIHQP